MDLDILSKDWVLSTYGTYERYRIKITLVQTAQYHVSHLSKTGSSITYQYWTCELHDAIQPRRWTDQLVQGVMFNWTVVNVDTTSECEINAFASEFMYAGVF